MLMTLPNSWETLVVSLSNNPNLTVDGVKGSILNKEIRRKLVEREVVQSMWLEEEQKRKVRMYKGTGAKAKARLKWLVINVVGKVIRSLIAHTTNLNSKGRRTQVTRRKRTSRMKHVTTLRTRTKRRPLWPLLLSLRSHQMPKIFFVLLWAYAATYSC